MAKKAIAKVTARMLLDLLAIRHAGDVFVPECKDGPSQGTKHLRMDAWAMKRSWSHPHVLGYEIKISRADFLADDKWRGYLPYCNSFSFVSAPGVIQPGELPDDVGWIVAASTGRNLFTKKKAPYRDVQIPENIWRYVLMCRARITEDNTTESHREFWRRWLASKEQSMDIGRRVGRKLRTVISENINRVRCENYRLQRELERLQGVRDMLVKEFGFDPKGIVPDEWAVRRKLTGAQREVGVDHKRLAKSLGNARNFIDQAMTWLNSEEKENTDGYWKSELED